MKNKMMVSYFLAFSVDEINKMLTKYNIPLSQVINIETRSRTGAIKVWYWGKGT
jgi:hypothetical protein